MLAAALLGVIVSGPVACNMVTAAAYILTPDPTIEALCTLEPTSVVVFIDDRGNLLRPTRLRRTIAESASETMLANGVVAIAISPRDAFAAASGTDRVDAMMPIDEIGRTVGADQIVYVEMTGFSLSADGYTPTPVATFGVRVLDVVGRQRIFPVPEADDPSHAMRVTIERLGADALRTSTHRQEVMELLARRCGERIAQLFYERDAARLGDRLEER